MRNIVLKKTHIFLLVVILLLSIPLYRVYLRQVINVKLIDIEISGLSNNSDLYYRSLGASEQQAKDIIYAPYKYKEITYRFNIKNISKKTSVIDINIKPEFSNNMQNIVVGYERSDGVAPVAMYSLSEIKKFPKRVIVKSEGYTDKELIEMAKKDKFTIIAITGNSLLDIGYNSKTVKYQQ